MRRPLARLRQETPILPGSAEIDVDAADLATGKGEELRVAKASAICPQTEIGDEGLVAPDENPLDVVPRDPAGVLPAALEIGRLVEVVVERTGEAEIVGQCVGDPLPVVAEIGCEEVSNQALAVVRH
ncbi:hypothetical protein BKD09_10110 [Bradyrhizobium japonicum]|uniref:Uncharacterized protein n=1 Tax=Bradyrhizobium japonicum TaxID=375 RepID=A0A1L3F5W2_BRAJP|nr:hypothetical protein BKD09_10110 [Bradyrhizobium japonicum]